MVYFLLKMFKNNIFKEKKLKLQKDFKKDENEKFKYNKTEGKL